MHPSEPLRVAAPSDARGALPPAHWTVLILCDVLRWPAADAAALLGTTREELDTALRAARVAVGRGEVPGAAERAALGRLVGSTDARVLSLTGALLREHAPPAARPA